MAKFMEIVRSTNGIENGEQQDYLTIGSFFKDYQYCIPSYQRMYEWDDRNVFELWDDLLITKKELTEDEKYFIGVTFYSREFSTPFKEDKSYSAGTKEGSVSLSDGQQRSTTFMLMFAAIKNKLNIIKANANKEEFDTISSLTKMIDGMIYHNNKLRVLPISNDGKLQKEFSEVIKYSGSMDSESSYEINDDNNEIKNTRNRFNKNYWQLFKLIEDDLKDDINKIGEFIDFVKDKIVLIMIRLDNSASLNTRKFFNRLNSRGKKLDEITEIRNEMHLKYVKKIGKYNEKWFNKCWEDIFNNFSNAHAVKLIGLNSIPNKHRTNQQSYFSLFKEEKINKDKLIKDIRGNKVSANDIDVLCELSELNTWKYSMKYKPSEYQDFIEKLKIKKSSKSSYNVNKRLEFNIKLFMALTHHELWIILKKSVIELIMNSAKTEYETISEFLEMMIKQIKRFYVLTDGKSPVTKYDIEISFGNDSELVSTSKLGAIYDKIIYRYYLMSNNENIDIKDLKNQIEDVWNANKFYNELEEEILIWKCNTFSLKSEYNNLNSHSFLSALLIRDEKDKLIDSLTEGNWDADHILEKSSFESLLKGKIIDNYETTVNSAFNIHPLPNSVNRNKKDDYAEKIKYYSEQFNYSIGQDINDYSKCISTLMKSYKGMDTDIDKWIINSKDSLSKQLSKCIGINLPQ